MAGLSLRNVISAPRAANAFHKTYHTEFCKQAANGTHQYANCHNVEHRFHEQVVCRLHECVQHVGQCHLVGQEPEEADEEYKEYYGLEAAFVCELERSFDASFYAQEHGFDRSCVRRCFFAFH